MKTIDKFSRRTVFFLVLFLTFVGYSNHLFAQDNAEGAEVTVRVIDPQRASLENAEVTLYTRDGRIRISCMTDNAGACLFKQLAAGEYLVEAEASGFARAATHVLACSATVKSDS